jgi:CRISPR-associated protein Cas1
MDERPVETTASRIGSGLLERILAIDTLRFAWHRVHANAGGPGADAVSLRRFARLLDANLLALADDVRNGTYRPGRLRRTRLVIRGKSRSLSILPVRDRVLQRATLDVLTPLVDPTFAPTSFGYRPGRSVQDAVERIVRLRDRGFGWVVDADIDECFPSLDHDLLRGFVADLIVDVGVRRLIDGWLTAAHAREAPPRRGVRLGGVMSPLLCNVYLHHLDRSLHRRRYHVVRYADDFVVLCKSEAHAARAMRATEKVLRGLNLHLEPRKTRIASFDEGFTFLGVTFEGTDYSYVIDGTRFVVDDLPPDWFYYHADAYE